MLHGNVRGEAMKTVMRGAALGLLVLAVAGSAVAAPVTVAQTLGGVDSFGDPLVADGFGAETTGVAFDSFDIGFGDPEGTDALGGDVTLSFSLARPAGTVTEARLVLRTGGYGLYGLAQVVFNGTLLGTLTDGDAGNPLDPFAYNDESAHVDVFDIFALGGSLATDGNDVLEILVPQANDDFLDWGSVDYAVLQLTIATDDTGGTVPEPSGLALAGLALAVAGAARRRRAAR
jgi:hypothetical protein